MDQDRWNWGSRDTDVCRIAGKRKDGLFTLRVDQDMLQRIADEFGVDDPQGFLTGEESQK
jgi:hypothetical protein